jgi:hypothetical protein
LPHRRRLPPHGHDPHHAAAVGRKALSMNRSPRMGSRCQHWSGMPAATGTR